MTTCPASVPVMVLLCNMHLPPISTPAVLLRSLNPGPRRKSTKTLTCRKPSMTTCHTSVPVMVLLWAHSSTHHPPLTPSNLLGLVTLDPYPPSNDPGPFQNRQ
jgi:hypothetical protein